MATQRKQRSWHVVNSAGVAPGLPCKNAKTAFQYLRHVCQLMRNAGYILDRARCRTKIRIAKKIKEVWLAFGDPITRQAEYVRLVEYR